MLQKSLQALGKVGILVMWVDCVLLLLTSLGHLAGRGKHKLGEGVWVFFVLGSFLPAMASFSKALLSLPGPKGRQHDSGSALMLREPTVPPGRESGQGLPAVELGCFVEVMLCWI